MHILIMNWRDPKHPNAGGAEIVTFEHARRWVKRGHKVTWLTAWFYGVPREEVVEGVHFVRRGGSLTIYAVAPFYVLRHATEFTVIVDEIHGLPFFTPLYTRTPKVAFIHEIAKEIWGYMAPFPLNIAGRILEPMYLLLYRQIRFWTDAPSTVTELVCEGVPKKNCVVIPCPVSNAIIKKIPTKEREPTFLYISRLVKMKGIEDVLVACAYIAKKLPRATLWVAGEGDPLYLARLKQMVSDLGIENRVKFLGKISQRKKLELMRRAHILLHASVREGWGLVVLESASQGTPAIVYDVPGLRDVVHNGQTGIVVKHNTPRELGNAAVALFHDTKKYSKLQSGSLTWVRSLRWDDVADRSLKLLTSLLPQAARP